MRHNDVRELLGAELISVTGGVLAGTMLAFSINNIALVPGLFILIPGFLEMRGNISGSLSARLSSALFLNKARPRLSNNFVLGENVKASILLAVIVSFSLGSIAYLAGFLFGINNPMIIAIALLAGMFSNAIEIPLTVMFNFWLFRKGYDPNNIMGPYVTTLGDIVSIFSILIAVLVM